MDMAIMWLMILFGPRTKSGPETSWHLEAGDCVTEGWIRAGPEFVQRIFKNGLLSPALVGFVFHRGFTLCGKVSPVSVKYQAPQVRPNPETLKL